MAGGLYTASKQPKKIMFPMMLSVVLISTLIGAFSILAVDKYTKIAKLYKVENKRLLSIEKTIYTGIVKNEVNYEIGEVVFEVKLVNKGHVTGNVKAGSFFAPSSLIDFFSGADILYKPQTIVKRFVVATNLKPGEAQHFRVYFDYPPYFRNVSQFFSVEAH